MRCTALKDRYLPMLRRVAARFRRFLAAAFDLEEVGESL